MSEETQAVQPDEPHALSREVSVPESIWPRRLTYAACALMVFAIPAVAMTPVFMMPDSLDGDEPPPEPITIAIPYSVPAFHQTVAVVPTIAAPQASGEDLVYLTFKAGGRTYMHLRDADAESTRFETTSTPVVAEDGDSFEKSAYVDVPAPRDLAHWIGRAVAVDNGCTTTVRQIRVISRMSGDLDYASAKEATEPAERAKLIFESGHRVYAARLGGCQGNYAAALDRKPLLIGKELKLGEASKTGIKAAKRHFRRTAPVYAAQEEFKSYKGNKGHWLTQAGIKTKLFVPRSSHSNNNGYKGILVVYASMMEGCGDFEGGVWASYEVDIDNAVPSNPLLKLGKMLTVEHNIVHDVRGAVDANGDGILDIEMQSDWTERTVHDAHGGALTSLSVPFFGCRC